MRKGLYEKKIRSALIVVLLSAGALMTACGKNQEKPLPDAPSVTETINPASSIATGASDDPLPDSSSGTLQNDGNTEASSEPAPLSEPFSVTLAFAGDINFDDTWSVMSYLHSQGDDLTKVIDPAYLEAMRAADLLWINNEFSYSDRGAPMAGKAYTFRSDPSNVKYLTEMGVDIVGLANNHVFDYGEDAFFDTLQTLEDAGIPYVGAGRDITEAATPVFLQADDVTVAYVAASRAEKNIMTPEASENTPGILRCYDMTQFLDSIKKAAEQADYVIALPHWGTEYSTTLEQAQIDGAIACIDAGADAVIGAHTHCLQDVTSYQGKPIVYSLGNFWFNEKTLDTMLYELQLDGIKTIDPSGEIDISITEVTPIILPGIQSGCITTMAVPLS